MFNKNRNLTKSVAFFLICAVLTLGLLYASLTGDKSDFREKEDIPPIEDDILAGTEPKDEEEDKKIPSYHFLTGFEKENSSVHEIPIATVISQYSPFDLLTEFYLLIEIPRDTESTRLIGFSDYSPDISEIGSFSSPKDYMMRLTAYFSAITLYYDTETSSSHTDYSTSINLKEALGYYYKDENGGIFINGELLSSILINEGIATVRKEPICAPFSHVALDNDFITYENSLPEIEIASEVYTYNRMVYSDDTLKYTVFSSDVNQRGKEDLSYENVFIIFTDAVTYESEAGSSLSLLTDTGGRGIYATRGSYSEFTWSVAEGELLFFDENGDKLVVNPGKSFISYVKSSEISKVILK